MENRLETVHDWRLVDKLEFDRQWDYLECFGHIHATGPGTGSGKPLFAVNSHLHRRERVLPTPSHHCRASSGPEDLFIMYNHMFWFDYIGRLPGHDARTVVLNKIQCTAFVHTWKQMILMRILLGIFMVLQSLVRQITR